MLQPPQFFVSVRKLAVGNSQPSPASLLQSAKFALHWPMVQPPFTHWPVALMGAQVAPQAPQFFVSARMFDSQPVAKSLSQSRKLPLHMATVHLPMAQP